MHWVREDQPGILVEYVLWRHLTVVLPVRADGGLTSHLSLHTPSTPPLTAMPHPSPPAHLLNLMGSSRVPSSVTSGCTRRLLDAETSDTNSCSR